MNFSKVNETKANFALDAHIVKAEYGLTLSAKRSTIPFESPGFESTWACFKAKAVVFFHMVQDCADGLGFWFGDKYNSQKQKWQGLEPSSALFAVGLNKWNGHKVCSQNHH